MAAPRTLSIESSYPEIRRAAEWLRGSVGRTLDETAAGDLELAVVEVLTNIVRHAYLGRPGQSIRLSLATDGNGARLLIRDEGIHLPDAVLKQAAADEIPPSDPLDALAESGRGLALIRACVDELHYDRRGGSNRTVLTKRSTASIAKDLAHEEE